MDSKFQYTSLLKASVLISCSCAISYLLVSISLLRSPKPLQHHPTFSMHSPHTTLNNVVFGIASSTKTWRKHKEYVKLWWQPESMRGCIFVDRALPGSATDFALLPPVRVSQDVSRFRGGSRSVIRIAQIVVELVPLFNNDSNVRWFVFGDDDTIFFPDNLAKTLSKYDHRLWYYIGSNSEMYKQNSHFGFGMAFGGGGYVISRPLAETLARVMDSCNQRYPHECVGDARVYACMSELGVGLTHEPGFHQFDVRGNVFGLLASHPLSPLVSLHHIDHIHPIFPNMETSQSLRRLFEAAKLDPHRLLHHSVCYLQGPSPSTVSISWGYAVQIYGSHMTLRDVLPVQTTFRPFINGGILSQSYMFKTRGEHRDPCLRPRVFFFTKISMARYGYVRSVYRKFEPEKRNCSYNTKALPWRLEEIRVYSHKLQLDMSKLKAPRRQCCDILPPPADNVIEIAMRECENDELVHPRR